MAAETNVLDPDARITLCVATRDRPELVARHFLPSLRGLEPRIAIVVVDQSTTSETAELLRGVDRVAYVHMPEAGLSRARNLAVRRTGAPFLAFTDDDVTFGPEWPARMAALLEASPGAGAVCGRGRTPDGVELPGVPAGVYRRPRSAFGLGSGFNFAFRRAALAAAGPFDEELGAGARYRAAEDTDMLYRVMRAGWSVVCSDDVTVVHHDWRGRAAEVRLHYGYGLGAGAQTAKHLAAGDGVAGRIAAREVALHLVTLVRAVLTGRPRVALLQPPYLAGLAVGLASRLLRARGAAGQPVSRA